jgi:hypothetical protein
MRLTCLLVVALFAGCLGQNQGEAIVPPASDAPSLETGAAAETQLPPQPLSTQLPANDSSTGGNSAPAPMHWEGMQGWVAMPAFGPFEECEAPLTGCNGPSFTTTGTYDLQAKLSWTLPTNDFDLYLYNGSGAMGPTPMAKGVSGPGPVSTEKILDYPALRAGTYRLWLVPQHGVKMDYELDATFT